MAKQHPQPSLPLILDVLRTPDLESFLERWGGEKIFKRGKNYFQRGYVKDLVITPNGRLLATVKGSRDYISALYLDETGNLAGDCTCPYDDICKHIVALALQAGAILQEEKAVPACNDFDIRADRLGYSRRSAPPVSPADLERALGTLSKDKLLELLLKACALNKDIATFCAVAAGPDTIGLQALVNDAKSAIREAADSGFEDDYDRDPDYFAIARKLEAITEAGEPDITLDLAKEVFDTCSAAIDNHAHEENIISDLATVAETSLAALKAAGWALEKKLLWAIKAILWDDFGYCEPLEKIFEEITEPAIWLNICNYLGKLQALNLSSFQASELRRLQKLALERSGSLDAILKLYIEEAREKHDYSKLVDFLLKHGQVEEAEKWIIKGIKAARFAYEARNLRERWINICENRGDYDAITALCCEIFLESPDVRKYRSTALAAESAGYWEALRPLLYKFLITGKLPWLDDSWPCRFKCSSAPAAENFPLYRPLIELAIHEERPLDALRWYDSQRESGSSPIFSALRIAEAIKEAAPERALAIWQTETERLVEQTSSASYYAAGELIRKMLLLIGDSEERKSWRPWLQSLRTRFKRKRNFIRILDEIEKTIFHDLPGG